MTKHYSIVMLFTALIWLLAPCDNAYAATKKARPAATGAQMLPVVEVCL